MRCKSCNEELTDQEATTINPLHTQEYEDLCGYCLRMIRQHEEEEGAPVLILDERNT